jgi:hypothetical protein
MTWSTARAIEKCPNTMAYGPLRRRTAAKMAIAVARALLRRQIGKRHGLEPTVDVHAASELQEPLFADLFELLVVGPLRHLLAGLLERRKL